MKRIIEGPYAYGCLKGDQKTVYGVFEPLLEKIASSVPDKMTPSFVFLTGKSDQVVISDPVAMDSLSGNDFVRTEKYRVYRDVYRTLVLLELEGVSGLVAVDFPREKMSYYLM